MKLRFLFSLFQLITPKFPVVVKIGHAHSGMGKVSLLLHLLHIGPDSLVDKASASGAGGLRFDSQCRRHWGSF